MKQKLLFVLMWMLLLPTRLFAFDFEYQGIYYETYWDKDDDGKSKCYAAVTRSYEQEYSGDLVIPDTVEYGDETLVVRAIGKYAFVNCSRLNSISIPETVTTIDENVFEGCMELREIIVKPTNDYFFSFNKSLYNKDLTTIIKVPAKLNIDNFVIPETVVIIGNYAFQECNMMTSVNIPESVTTIGKGAFSYCTQITSITLPNSVTSIGEGAFEWCSKLSSIKLPEGITTVERDIFTGCHSLTSIKIPEKVTSIGGYAFYGCSSLTSLSIPTAVTSIGVNALLNCSNMKEILVDPTNEYFSTYNKSLYNKDQTILYQVPGGYENPTYDDFPDAITTIGEDAFWNCEWITSIDIPETVSSIGKSAFSGCKQLTAINIPEAITTIEYTTFGYCESLKSIIIPKNVELIDQWAFRGCTNLFDVYSLNPQAPQTGTNPFYQIPSDALLYVPKGSVESYVSSEGWSAFSHIYEIGQDTYSLSFNVKCGDFPIKDATVIVLDKDYTTDENGYVKIDDLKIEDNPVIKFSVYKDGFAPYIGEVDFTESKEVTINVNMEESSSVYLLPDKVENSNIKIYNLNGHQVKSMKGGQIYIIEGRKICIKG